MKWMAERIVSRLETGGLRTLEMHCARIFQGCRGNVRVPIEFSQSN